MTIKNLPSFKKNMKKKLSVNVKKNVLIGVIRATGIVEDTVQTSIKNKGTGRVYKRKGEDHIASAAGQPPATDQGNLANNITTSIKSKSNGSVIGQVISSAKYSKSLEFGTTNMQARPFMQPALNKNKSKIIKIFKEMKVTK